MKFLVRRLEGPPKPWSDMMKNGSVQQCLADPPTWALREFTPAPDDEDGLSVFEVEYDGDDDSELRRIAAAFAFHSLKPIEAGKHVFVGVPREDVEASGLEVLETAGKQQIAFADDRHREIRIVGADHLIRTAKLFLGAETVISIEGTVAANEARATARNDEIGYLSLHKRFDKSGGGKNLVRFVAEQIVVANGVRTKVA